MDYLVTVRGAMLGTLHKFPTLRPAIKFPLSPPNQLLPRPIFAGLFPMICPNRKQCAMRLVAAEREAKRRRLTSPEMAECAFPGNSGWETESEKDFDDSSASEI